MFSVEPSEQIILDRRITVRSVVVLSVVIVSWLAASCVFTPRIGSDGDSEGISVTSTADVVVPLLHTSQGG